MDRYTKILLIGLAIGLIENMLDLATTYYLMWKGIGYEFNPIAAKYINYPLIAVALSFAAYAFIAWLAWELAKHSVRQVVLKAAAIMLALSKVWPVVNNFYIIFTGKDLIVVDLWWWMR